MKKTFAVSFCLIIFSGITLSDTKWSEIVYHYQTGTIPPPNFYKYDLTINSAGFGTMVYYPDYSEMDTWVFAVQIPAGEIEKLDKLISEPEIISGSVPSLPDSLKPIGGPLQNLTIILQQDPNLDQVPPRVTLPYFPAKEYEMKLNKIYGEIIKMVPQTTWDNIKARKDKFIEDYKK
jgi:hypothetical protein